MAACAAAALAEFQFDLAQARAQLSRRHGDSWTALVYEQLGEQLAIITLTPGEVRVERRPLTAQLRRSVERATAPAYRHHIYQRPAQAPGPDGWGTLDQLGELLIPGHALARLHADHCLLVVPGGPLHALPWAALRVAGGWLVERAVIQVLPALRLLQLPGPPAGGGRRALLLGCSQFGGRAPDLPGVAEELAAIAAILRPGWEATTGHAITLGELRRRSERGELSGCRLLHIASHAQLRADAHRAAHRAAHIKLRDADLPLSEAAALRLAGATVVLSACEGAAAQSLPGDEVISLAWALLAAGAGEVIASLWPIYDQVAIARRPPAWPAREDIFSPAVGLIPAQGAPAAYTEAGGPRAPRGQARSTLCLLPRLPPGGFAIHCVCPP